MDERDLPMAHSSTLYMAKNDDKVDDNDNNYDDESLSWKRDLWSPASPNPGERVNVWGRKRYFIPSSLAPGLGWKLSGMFPNTVSYLL